MTIKSNGIVCILEYGISNFLLSFICVEPDKWISETQKSLATEPFRRRRRYARMYARMSARSLGASLIIDETSLLKVV